MPNESKSRNSSPFARSPLPRRFCNLDRLLSAMKVRGLDGIVASTPNNVFYLTGFNGVSHKSDEPRQCAVILSRHAPEHPIFVVADYFLGSFLIQPTWVEDIRPFRTLLMSFDVPPKPDDVDRCIPSSAAGVEWIERARRSYVYDMGDALRGALKDLKLDRGRVAFDDLGFGFRLGLEGTEVVDGYDPLMFARAVKTETELKLLERATQLNESAINATVASWQQGATWRDLNRSYERAVCDLGGFVHDPGGFVWGPARGMDPAVMLATGLENDEVTRGTHVMFDCHGSLDLYCWDGGKTWVVDGEPEGAAKLVSKATAAAGEALLNGMRPGAKVSTLQAIARDVYRKCGVPNPASAMIFFHGLGLSHMDIEQTTADGKRNADWTFEEGMVVPLHLLYPGGERERLWLEEVVAVTSDGGRPLFSWGLEPLTGRGASAGSRPGT